MNKIIFKDKEYDISDFKHDIIMDKNIHRIAVVMHRTPSLIALLCECLDKGITYIPIDPSLPKERISHIIDDSCPDCIITDFEINFLKSSERSDIAYIAYTSGSSGLPKGVEVSFESINSFIDALSLAVDFGKERTIVCLTSVSFDIFFIESTFALRKGLNVVLASDEEANNPRLISKLIENNNVDIVQMTPSRMQMLLNFDSELSCMSKVKDILIGGEVFPQSLLKILQNKTGARIYNLYGPTETTIFATIADLTNKEDVNIGKPLTNAEIYILNEQLRMVPYGETGEICISGKCLAKGYHNSLELTEEKFLELPGRTNKRVYRTGDVGRFLPDGSLEYKGRLDNQVKIHGYRIELEEIEAHFCHISGVKQAIATIIASDTNDQKVAIYYTSDISIDEDDIEEYLSTKVPRYCIPSIYIRVQFFKHTNNGKIDRKSVHECPVINKKTNIKRKTKLSKAEQEILDFIVMISEGKIDANTDINCDLKKLGFDSISFVKLIIQLEERFGFEFEAQRFLINDFASIMSIIKYITSIVF